MEATGSELADLLDRATALPGPLLGLIAQYVGPTQEQCPEIYRRVISIPIRWNVVMTVCPADDTKDRRELFRQATSVFQTFSKDNKVDRPKRGKPQTPPNCVLALGSASKQRQLTSYTLGPADCLWVVGHGNPTVVGTGHEGTDDYSPTTLAAALEPILPRDLGQLHILSCNSGHEHGPYLFVRELSLELFALGFENTIVYGYIGYSGETNGRSVVTERQENNRGIVRAHLSRRGFIDGHVVEEPQPKLHPTDVNPPLG